MYQNNVNGYIRDTILYKIDHKFYKEAFIIFSLYHVTAAWGKKLWLDYMAPKTKLARPKDDYSKRKLILLFDYNSRIYSIWHGVAFPTS